MAQLTLPPVAKSFYTFCKKCESDRYHMVHTHTSSTTAKIECEVCHSRKTYSLPKPGGSSSSTRTRSAGAGSTGTRSGGGSARSHASQFEAFSQNQYDLEAKPFSIKAKFSENQKLSHPKFGIGFVIKAYQDKIDVVFSDEVRTLMHART